MGIKASIIIPVYNVEKYLKECLDSISLQTYSDWECILVDDGSKDSSGAICDSYAERDSRFVVIHKQNEGVSCARNTGLDSAKGEWVVFVDSDDIIQKNYLEELKKGTENNADFVFSGYTKFQDGHIYDKVTFKPGLFVINQFDRIIPSLVRLGTPWAKAYKRDIIEREHLRFDRKLSVSEDRLFMYSYLVNISSICILDIADYFYRYYSGSISFKRRKPEEYIYRFDTLGEKALLILSRWKLSLRSFYPFIDIHLQMEQDIIDKIGLSYLLENSEIAHNADYYGINKAPLFDRIRVYRNMGIKKLLVYKNKWSLYRRINNQVKRID